MTTTPTNNQSDLTVSGGLSASSTSRADLRHSGTAASQRRRKRLTQTHCKRGHKFTVRNTVWNKGHRECRLCRKTRNRASEDRRLAKRRALTSRRDRLIAAAPDMLAALLNVRKLISEAAMTGFNCKDGDWPERLFASQQVTSAAIARATTPASGDRGGGVR